MKRILPKLLSLALSLWLIANLFDYCYAKEITILYTGDTHAALYPCNCPIEPDGGVARRATLIKQLKKKNPDTLLLDAGSFFAGGLLDENMLNTQMDMQRTLVNLGAMELMGFDAVAIGDDEFNFGRGFLEENIKKSKLPFLSSNAAVTGALPYIIKDISGVKIGIIGLTNPSAQEKSGGLKIAEPDKAVGEAVIKLSKSAVDIIVLVGRLEKDQYLDLLGKVKGIDILITSYALGKEEPFSKIGNTLILRPVWQARMLGKLTFAVKNKRIENPKIEQIRLSDKIPDDAGILSILPRCFSDNSCRKNGIIGSCQDSGTMNSRCSFGEVNKINLLVISSRACATCNTTSVINFLKKHFPGLVVSYLYLPEKKADSLISELKIKGLPAYLLGREVEKEKNFDNFNQNLQLRGDYYILKAQVSGFALFLDRKKIKGKFDLFLSLFDKNTKGLLDAVKEFNPAIHFLVAEEQGRLEAAGGNYEIEESLRSVCVQKYYPEQFFSYMSCRSANIGSSWWEDCLGKFAPEKIKFCARGQEGLSLLGENIAINKEMQIMFGPTYLVDNQEIFSSKGVPSKEELKKIIKR